MSCPHLPNSSLETLSHSVTRNLEHSVTLFKPVCIWRPFAVPLQSSYWFVPCRWTQQTGAAQCLCTAATTASRCWWSSLRSTRTTRPLPSSSLTPPPSHPLWKRSCSRWASVFISSPWCQKWRALLICFSVWVKQWSWVKKRVDKIWTSCVLPPSRVNGCILFV